MGLVLPGQQHVAEALFGEGGGRAARAGGQDGHLVIELLHEGAGRGVSAARLFQRPAPGRQIVPSRPARRLGIGGDHRDVRADQVAPVVDLGRIALAHQKHDGRGIGRGVVGQAALPIGRQQLGLGGDLVDVEGQPQGDHIGFKAVDHRARLLARPAMALVDVDVLPGAIFPEADEVGVEILVQFARGIVADIEQLDGLDLRRGRKTAEERRGAQGGGATGREAQHRPARSDGKFAVKAHEGLQAVGAGRPQDRAPFPSRIKPINTYRHNRE